jgi:hypothetical protein
MSSESLRHVDWCICSHSENRFTRPVIEYKHKHTYRNYVRGILPALKQKPGGHKYKNDRKVEKVVTRFVITQDKYFHQIKSNIFLNQE